MKARLYGKEPEPEGIWLSDVPENTFCVALSGGYKNCVIYRPFDYAHDFAHDITSGAFWSEKPEADRNNPIVRILQPGELIEVME